MKTYEELNGLELDAIREIGSIGTGNAATALSSMLGCEVRISMPEVRIMGYNEAIDWIGGPEVITAGHCGMRVLGFTLLSNMGAGILDQPLSEQEVLDAAEACKDKFSRLVLACLERI